MKATELRIGNKLQYFLGEDGCEWEPTIIDWQDLKWATEKADSFNSVHKGIPITHKSLFDYGFKFEDHGDHGYYTREVGEWGIFTVDADGGGFQISSFQNTISTKIEFIHQLQNFYFAIVGEELVHLI